MTGNSPAEQRVTPVGYKPDGVGCEADCERHVGIVWRVQVNGSDGYDWGQFFYCDSAIKEDKRRGLKVELLHD